MLHCRCSSSSLLLPSQFAMVMLACLFSLPHAGLLSCTPTLTCTGAWLILSRAGPLVHVHPLTPWCCCWSTSLLSLASHVVLHPYPLAPLALCVHHACLAFVWLLPAWLCIHADPCYPVTLGWPLFMFVCTHLCASFIWPSFVLVQACLGSLGL